MISLDTNVLVRFLLDESEAPGRVDADYVEQRKAAQRLVHGALAAGTRVFLSTIVLCELVWVLRIFYKVQKADVVARLDQLVAATEVVIQDRALVLGALGQYRKGRADFADYLIAESASAAQVEAVYTFDKSALRTAPFRRPA